MRQRIVPAALVLVLPLCAQQVIPRPSPFPEINRQRALASEAAEAAAAKKAARQPVSLTRRARAKTAAAIGPAVTSSTVPSATGRASFFTSRADGALTASGVLLDAGKLVAGHATYPLGSLVKVTNLANGQTVEVQIVDRFPDSRRIINVSEEAARQLGFIKAGTAEVRVEMAELDAAAPPMRTESARSDETTGEPREYPAGGGRGH